MTRLLRFILSANAALKSGIKIKTGTGNPVTFTTTLERPFGQTKAHFSPKQAGSGTASPSNVRSISGWTGLNVYNSGEDTTDKETHEVTWETEAGTVYGGTMDLKTGILTVETICIDLKAFEYTRASRSSGGYCFKYASNDLPKCAVHTYSDAQKTEIASVFGIGNPNTTAGNLAEVLGSVPNPSGIDVTTVTIGLAATTVNTVAKFHAWLAEQSDVHITYPLKYPVRVQLTPQAVVSVSGTNAVWSDANGDMDITYYTKGDNG